jgi:signal transduction histidine kinase
MPEAELATAARVQDGDPDAWLREWTAGGGDAWATARATPSAALYLDVLVAGVTVAGLPTTIVVTGQLPSFIPPTVDLAAYRIVQESLTNAIRHAGPATATVDITYSKREVCLRITDTGPGPRAAGTSDGHGLIGMRERAAAAGGRLDVGRGPGGGFAITAHLPLEPGT